jgi:dTDP-4-dehydrorhamnose 3,5-epimerase
MGKFTRTETGMEGLVLLEGTLFGDERGFFMETYNEKEFAELGIATTFVQDNHSRSARGVLRGLHFQKEHPQGKLVRVVRGSVYDVAVALRRSSVTFGKWFGTVLVRRTACNSIFPRDLPHDSDLEDGTEFLYKCTDFYHPEDEGGILWSDPTLGVSWPCRKARSRCFLRRIDVAAVRSILFFVTSLKRT